MQYKKAMEDFRETVGKWTETKVADISRITGKPESEICQEVQSKKAEYIYIVEIAKGLPANKKGWKTLRNKLCYIKHGLFINKYEWEWDAVSRALSLMELFEVQYS